MPASRRRFAQPAAGDAIVRHGLRCLFADDAGSALRTPQASWYSPIVLVGQGHSAAMAAVRDVLQRSRRPFCGLLDWRGVDLAHAIAAADRSECLHRLAGQFSSAWGVLIEGIDAIPSGRAQDAFVHILDTATASGTAFCVSLAASPAAAGLSAALASRLSAGLVANTAVSRAEPRVVPRGCGHGKTPSMARIIRVASRHHGLSPESLVGTSRRRSVVMARSVGMYLARHTTALSLDAIGAAFGGRDHTTVMHSLRSLTEHMREDASLADEVDALLDLLVGHHAALGSPPARVESLSMECGSGGGGAAPGTCRQPSPDTTPAHGLEPRSRRRAGAVASTRTTPGQRTIRPREPDAKPS